MGNALGWIFWWLKHVKIVAGHLTSPYDICFQNLMFSLFFRQKKPNMLQRCPFFQNKKQLKNSVTKQAQINPRFFEPDRFLGYFMPLISYFVYC